MKKLLPPLCLFLALMMVFAGFALMARGLPQSDMELHRARVAGEEQVSELLEKQRTRRLWTHRGLIAGLFASAVLFTGAAFWTMKDAREAD